MPEPIPALPVPEYGVAPPRRTARTAVLVALMAIGGLLLFTLIVFGLRLVIVSPSRSAPATIARPAAPAPAVPPATAPATAPAAR